jgi:hypothetical protein
MEARRRSNHLAMEQALGNLVMDGGFRDAFFRDPADAVEDPYDTCLTRSES